MNRFAGCGVVICVGMGVGACGASDATGAEDRFQSGVSLSASAAPHTAALMRQRSVKGHLDGSDEYAGACGGGQGFVIISTGTGVVSHFGNAVMVSTICANLTDFSIIGPAPYSIRAADGDEAGGFVTGLTFTSYGFDLSGSITWGTGRFAGATGALVFPTVSTGPGTWSSGVEGLITY